MQSELLVDPPAWRRPEAGERPERCLLCGGSALDQLFEKAGKAFWSCRGCSLVFVHDIYPEYEAFDDAEYHDLVKERTRLKKKERLAHAKLLASFERAVAKRGGVGPGRLLEVGCGHGFFLEQAQEAGWDVMGVELVPHMVEITRGRGVEVFEGELADAAFEAERFDVVYTNEVIEHLPDPVGLMREVHRVLAPGGIAVLRTGNGTSWSARWRGKDWPYFWFCPHGHIRFYGPRSAKALAFAAGFESVEVTTRGFAFREGDELDGHWAKPLVKAAQAPLSPLAGWLDAGHRLTMRFQKGT